MLDVLQTRYCMLESMQVPASFRYCSEYIRANTLPLVFVLTAIAQKEKEGTLHLDRAASGEYWNVPPESTSQISRSFDDISHMKGSAERYMYVHLSFLYT